MDQCVPGQRFTLEAAVRQGPNAALRKACAVSGGRCGARGGLRRTGSRQVLSRTLVACVALSLAGLGVPCASAAATKGIASWYGEEHRGKLMANGKRFNPDKFTAASWFYPLGTKVLVTLTSASQTRRSVVVTITDRGPTSELVRDGRIIDLSHAPFRRLAHPDLGLVAVAVQPLR